MTNKDLVEKIADYFNQREDMKDEIVGAKSYYFEQTGKVFDQDSYYESRMTNFVEWFVLDRPIQAVGITPARLYYEIFSASLEETEKKQLVSLMSGIHSLFKVKSKSKKELTLVDLYSADAYSITMNTEWFGGHENDIFEGRVILMPSGHYEIGDTICFHPPAIGQQIIDGCKKLRQRKRGEFLQYILKLSYYKLRVDQYRNKIDPNSVYRFDNIIPAG